MSQLGNHLVLDCSDGQVSETDPTPDEQTASDAAELTQQRAEQAATDTAEQRIDALNALLLDPAFTLEQRRRFALIFEMPPPGE